MEQRIKGTTGLMGLIGSPIGHSGSPDMYNFCFRYHGLDYAYLAFDIKEDQVGEAMDAVRTLRMRGCNVTMPCKNETVKYMDELSAAARIVGAVNTIDRIVDAFPPSQQGQIRVQLSMVLQAVVSQQLISCKDGRVVPAFEIMLCNPAIRTMIRESKTHQIDSAIFSSSGEGMVGMDTSLMRLYEQGMISSEEALLHSASPDLLKKRMKL